MASTTAKQILTDLSPLLCLYTDGTVQRLYQAPYVPPSPDDPTTGVASKDTVISSTLSARLYLPKKLTSNLPILLYYHGGGFCLGSAFDSICHAYVTTLTDAVGALVVSVEYRLAPEYPLPAAYSDSWDALNWVCSLQKDPWIAAHGDFTKLYVAGDSAGGNIAHHMAMRAGSDPLPGNVEIRGAILLYPFFLGSDLVEGESKERPELAMLERTWEMVYPSAAGGIDSPWINPIGEGAARLSGMGCGKIQICVSEKDALTARAKAYAERLRMSGWGGEVEVVDIQGEDHCFQVHAPHTNTAVFLMKKIASFISAF